MADSGGWKTGEQPAASGEGRVAGWLDRIPGYRGYRTKEDRRDADRRVRDQVSGDLDAFAARAERIARDLANQRRLAEIGPVDEVVTSLRFLSDRVRTASYGYGGLFSDREIDEAAIDQLRRFDEGILAAGVELEAAISALESTHAGDGDLPAAARAARDVAGRLHARFDLRGEVISYGEAAPRERVESVLAPLDAGRPSAAFQLGNRDAVSILGEDFIVDARVNVSAPAGAFRLFRLSTATPERWLAVSADPAQPPVFLRRVEPPATSGDTLTLDGTTYAATRSGTGEGELATGERASGQRRVGYRWYAGDGDARALLLDWESERSAYVGTEVALGDVEIYGAARG